jgi:glucose-1-phosphate thymidylyltransferase
VNGWYDCGQLGTLLDTNRHLLENGRALRPAPNGTNVKVIDPVRVAPGVTLENVTIGPNVTVDEGSVLRNAEVRDSILGRAVRIEDASLHDSMIGDQAVVSRASGSLSLGDHSEVHG